MPKSKLISSLYVSAAFAVLATSPAMAQNAAPTPAPAEAEKPDGLGDIIVTAQRRQERIQDVAIAITVADAEALSEQRVFNVENINSISPSITFRTTNLVSSSSNIQIRGIGTTGNARSFEGSVGVFIDGVYRTRSGQALANFLDIDSLQVLRGPQGTLFGKNTSAGALLLTSAVPDTQSLGGKFEAGYGNYDAYRVMGAINLPLGDTAAIRVAAVQSDQDGFFRNVNGGRLNETKNQAVKAQFLFEPTDSFKVQLIGDYAKATGNCCYGTARFVDGPLRPLIDALTLAQGKAIPSATFDSFEGSIFPNTPTRVEDYGGTLLMDLNVGNGTLKSITALRKYDVAQVQDADFSGADILRVNESFSSKFFSQELNYNGEIEGGLNADYIVGAFYSHEKIGIGRQSIHGALAQPFWNTLLGAFGIPPGLANAAPGVLLNERLAQTGKSYAVFTHWNFKLSDQWSIIAGLRGSREVKRGSETVLSVRDPIFDPFAILSLTPPKPFTARAVNEAISGTFGIQYRPSSDAMLYLTYNRGFKAGGVILDNTAAGLPGSVITGAPATTADPRYKKETVDAVEGGAKVDWADGRARTNLSVFYNKLSNLQVAQFIGLRFTVLNAPSAEVYGAEIEQTFKLSPEVTLTGAATYLPKADFGTSVALGAPLSGRRFADVPKFAGQVALNGDFPLTDSVALNGRVQLLYTGSMFTNTAANERQSSFALINANLGVTLDERWTIEGWVQNLTDKTYATEHFQVPLQGGSVGAYLGAPRTYGVTLRGSF